MEGEIKQYATGSILPLGDGATGKTVLTRLLLNPNMESIEHGDILLNTRKSHNIEIEFSSEVVDVDGEETITSLQFYVFPGQRQKASTNTTTFDEILAIFDWFPAMEKINVILFLHDASRFHTLTSLEMWLRFSIVKNWIWENTLIILVTNKTDLLQPKEEDIKQVCSSMYKLIKEHEFPIEEDQVRAISTSCVTLEGVNELRKEIISWVARKGMKLKGIR